jgi:hypothetical protein
MTNKRIVFFFLAPILLSFILHFHVFKLDLIGYHVWRQSQTQTVIYNFTFSDNSIFHPQRFDISKGTALLYEFPLYQWIIAQINNSIGYSVTHTRGVTFLIFGFFLFGFYKLLTQFSSKERALITNVLICFSPLLYYYCVNPLPDIMALCLSIWSLNFFFKHLKTNKQLYFILFGILISLAALVKLPYLLFGGGFLVYSFKELKKGKYLKVLLKAAMLVVLLLPVLFWYRIAIPTWNENGITVGMFANTKSLIQLLDYLQFNVISSIPELLTNYASCVFLFVGIYFFFKEKKWTNEYYQYFIFISILILTYFLLELNMIEKTHDYYLMPFIPVIFLVVAYGVGILLHKKQAKFVFLIIGIVPLTAWLRIDHRWNIDQPGFTKEYLTEQKKIQQLIPANDLCIIDYDDSKFIALYYLKRKGFALFKNELNPDVLKKYYLKNAKFLVSESNSFDPNNYQEFNFEKVMDTDLKIYKLSLK